MQKLVVFNSTSLDGYFTDARNDMSFAHNEISDAEWDAFVAGNASGGGRLVLGRITYELMAGFWPTPPAADQMPVVAERMNNLQKVVFSRTMSAASWNNTKLFNGDLIGNIRKMKEEPGDGMAILGSGSLVSQLAGSGLIDEYQIVVIPIILGKGRTMFEGIKDKLSLKLTKSRTFANGNILLCYEPTS
jgi:dihydrofolate reductase